MVGRTVAEYGVCGYGFGEPCGKGVGGFDQGSAVDEVILIASSGIL